MVDDASHGRPVFDEWRLDGEHRELIDHSGALRALATAGAQVRHGVTLATEAGIDRVNAGDRPRSVIVASLGGSAVVAEILGVLADSGAPVPVTVCHNAPLPGWIGALDLVIAVSQSGRAPGPVALVAEAARRGAGVLTVGAPDTPLEDACAAARGIHVPIGGSGSSRTSLWGLVTPVLMAGSRLGLVAVDDSELDRLAVVLDERATELRPSSDAFVNPAKVLASDLAGRIPVVLGDGALTGVAAHRASSMLARTARTPATSGELPDAAAQVVACFGGPFSPFGAGGPAGSDPVVDDIFADPDIDGPQPPRLALLMLRDVLPEPVSPTDAARHNAAQAVIDSARDAGVAVHEVTAEPGTVVCRLASLIALVDFATTYLAIGLGLDPLHSPHVAELRRR